MKFKDPKSYPKLVHTWEPVDGDDPYEIYESDEVLLIVDSGVKPAICEWDSPIGIVTGHASKCQGDSEIVWSSRFDDEVGRSHKVLGWCEMPEIERM